MFHRRLSAVALVAVGALAVTAMSAPSSVAADTERADASSTNRDSGERSATVIVQLEEGGGDHASRYADVKKRIGEAVAQASPGATIEDVRDYHHVFEGSQSRCLPIRWRPSRACRESRGLSSRGVTSLSQTPTSGTCATTPPTAPPIMAQPHA